MISLKTVRNHVSNIFAKLHGSDAPPPSLRPEGPAWAARGRAERGPRPTVWFAIRLGPSSFEPADL